MFAAKLKEAIRCAIAGRRDHRPHDRRVFGANDFGVIDDGPKCA